MPDVIVGFLGSADLAGDEKNGGTTQTVGVADVLFHQGEPFRANGFVGTTEPGAPVPAANHSVKHHPGLLGGSRIFVGLLGIAALDAIKAELLETLKKFERGFITFLAAFHCFKNATFEGWSRGVRVLGNGAGTGQGSGGGETGSGEELAAVVRIDHDLVLVKVDPRLLEN